jgi:hypothetical protein
MAKYLKSLQKLTFVVVILVGIPAVAFGPDFLNYMYIDCLKTIKPEAVKIIR